MPDTMTAAPQASAEKKPSARQVYCCAHLMADMLGLDWPQDRQAASALIQKLTAHRDAEQAQGDGMAF